MAQVVEFFYDIGSPYSYLAHTQIERIASEGGAVLAWRPMLLGGVFKALGVRPATLDNPRLAAWQMRDLTLWAEHYGVPFRMNPAFPTNTLACMRLAVACDERGLQVPFLKAAFRAMWVRGENVAEEAVLRRCLEEAGAHPGPMLERTKSGHVKQRLKAITQEAVDRGVFGAPTVFVGDALFFGNDRLLFVEKALRANRT
ncbi:MAG: 2-hydroxychromene-2-carboxylate isomerase [Deltaproteobacteria bacterium]|nr:MAG: 2-hydroxychromene-2-carboxylate isomerase [Deltaproteobacteria bacterium]